MLLRKREPEGTSALWPFERWFEEFFSSMPSFFGRQEAFVPSLDVYEDADKLYVEAEVPGLGEKDIQVEVEGSVLTIRGEKSESHERKDGQVLRMERRYGSFARRLQLPENVDPDGATAKVQDGILRIIFPKRQEARRRSIKIQ